MIIRLVGVGVCDIPENLILREKEKVIRGRGDGVRGRALARVVRVLRNALERVTKVGGDSPHNAARRARLARAANIVSHVRVFPAAAVRVTRIHSERRRGAGRVIGAVGKANVRPAGEGRLRKLKMNQIISFQLSIMINANDIGVSLVII